MNIYSFSLVLHGVPDDEEDQTDIAEALYEGGCDDCLMASCEGVTKLHFDREAFTYDEAVASAKADVEDAIGDWGITIIRVESLGGLD